MHVRKYVCEWESIYMHMYVCEIDNVCVFVSVYMYIRVHAHN